MPRETTVIPGGWRFTWPDYHLSAEVSHITAKDDRVSGLLLIKTDAKDWGPVLLVPTQINFAADRTRKEIAKSLTEKYPTLALPWLALIDELAYAVQLKAREGEPVTRRLTSDDIMPPQWLVKPILFVGLPTIIFGEKAACKSTLGLVLYLMMSLPWWDNPLGWTVLPQPTKVLLLDWEVNEAVARWNLKRIQEGMNIPPVEFFHRDCRRPLADDLEQIQRHIVQQGIGAVIIDSLAPAIQGDLNSSEAASRFNGALRQLGVATLIIAQNAKNQDEKKRSVLGSTLYQYYSRHIFEIRRQQEEDSDDVEIALFNTYHNLTRKLPPMGFKLHFNETHTSIAKATIEAPQLRERMGTQARVLDELRRGGMTNKDLTEALGLSSGEVSMATKRLAQQNKVVRLRDGYWGLAAKEGS